LSYGSGIYKVDYRLKENLLSKEIDFWRLAAGTYKILKVKIWCKKRRNRSDNYGKNGK
jgi:hypothetical protein